jgi:hypothetical protein
MLLHFISDNGGPVRFKHRKNYWELLGRQVRKTGEGKRKQVTNENR